MVFNFNLDMNKMFSGQLDPPASWDSRCFPIGIRWQATSLGPNFSISRIREFLGQKVQLGEEVRARGCRDDDSGNEAHRRQVNQVIQSRSPVLRSLTVQYSGYLNSGNIWIANFYLFVIQMVHYSDARYHGSRHLNSRLVLKWWSEYWSSNQMVIWIPNYHVWASE